jgi:hypothetical protein
MIQLTDNITAEELILKKLTVYNNQISIDNAVKLMNLYAKIHCQSQLQAILNNAKSVITDYGYNSYVDKESIINAYDLNNVK